MTRALRLELLESMSAEHFLFGMRRFVARRGKQLQIVSDNAPQIRMSKSILENIWPKFEDDPEVRSYLCNYGIQWKVIAPRSPWMGGFYERLVGVVKSAIRKVLGKLILNRQQLEVLLFEIENAVNSRPPTHVPSGYQSLLELRPLTPADFLFVNAKGSSLPAAELLYYDFRSGSSGAMLQSWLKGIGHLDEYWNS